MQNPIITNIVLHFSIAVNKKNGKYKLNSKVLLHHAVVA